MKSTSSAGPESISDLESAAIAKVVSYLRQAVDLRVGAEADFQAKEEAFLEVSNEACRRALETDLQRRADELTGDEIFVRGVGYRRHEPGEVSYHSLCGSLRVLRHSYRKTGVHNGPTVVPLELVAPLIEATTPALAFSIAQGIARMPSRHYEEEMRGAFRLPPSRLTVERVAQRLGGLAKMQVVALEQEIRREEQVPAGAHAISIGLDRTSVPIIEERPPGALPTTRRKKRTAPYERQPPEPFDVVYRMAYVGTFTIVDTDGKSLVSRRYGATPEEGADELVERVMRDIDQARAQAPELPIAIVQDGAPELWGLVWNALRGRGITRWEQVIDRFHLNERLAAAIALVENDPDQRSRIFHDWQEALDHKNHAIRDIQNWLYDKRDRVPRRDRTTFDGTLNYISYDNFFRYARMRRKGLPVASGVTEGACKSLITTRFKRSGQRWYQDGLTAILTLRSLQHSDRLGKFWDRIIPHYSAPIRLAG